jgi:predicted nucleotidyltransferase
VTGPTLSLAVLFGSAASGRMHAHSDLDVGIVPVDPNLPLRAELDLQATLERTCGQPVDLIRLDQGSTLLRWEAARHGVPLLARSREELTRFVAAAALDHADLAWTLARAETHFRSRLLAGDVTSKNAPIDD